MEPDKYSQRNSGQRLEKNPRNGTSVMEVNQNTANINGKKETYCQQKN
jgi:hypothetical protein